MCSEIETIFVILAYAGIKEARKQSIIAVKSSKLDLR